MLRTILTLVSTGPRLLRLAIMLGAIGLPITGGAFALIKHAGLLPSGDAHHTRGAVVSVADGDTLTVLSPTQGRVKVRLLGIDTPESNTLRFGHTECGGSQAKAALKAWVSSHRIVTVTTDPTQDSKDRYGRTLGYVTASGESAQAAQLRSGWASVYVFNSSHPFTRRAHYAALADSARAARRGVWSACGGFPSR